MSPAGETEPTHACSHCGALTALVVAGRPLCEECYQLAGACCAGFADGGQGAGRDRDGSGHDATTREGERTDPPAL